MIDTRDILGNHFERKPSWKVRLLGSLSINRKWL